MNIRTNIWHSLPEACCMDCDARFSPSNFTSYLVVAHVKTTGHRIKSEETWEPSLGREAISSNASDLNMELASALMNVKTKVKASCQNCEAIFGPATMIFASMVQPEHSDPDLSYMIVHESIRQHVNDTNHTVLVVDTFAPTPTSSTSP